MFRKILLKLFALAALAARASAADPDFTFEYVYRDPADSSRNCCLACLPRTRPLRGLIVRDYTRLPDTARKSPYRLHRLAARRGIATIYTATSGPYPELHCDDAGPALLDELICAFVSEKRIPPGNVFVGGISASGTRALRYAQYCAAGKSKLGAPLAGVFAVDAPLDLARFYRSAARIKARGSGMLEEAGLMLRVLPERLGGPPDAAPERYAQASVYSFDAADGGQARLLRGTPLVLIHEPDTDWQLEERGADYYDLNSFDIAGFCRLLRSLGAPDLTLITTTGKGFARDGTRKPHSWTIVDEDRLIDWITARLQF